MLLYQGNQKKSAEDSVPEPDEDLAKRPSCQPSTSSAPDNSMATHAGSLSGGQDYSVANEQQEATAETKDKKSRKCCVIL